MKKPAKKAGKTFATKAVGTGLAAVAAAAIAGTYFLYGAKSASKHRKQVKAWSLKAKGEILEQLEKLSTVNEATYHKVIKQVASKYKTLKRLDAKDVVEFAEELQDHWKDIAKEIARSVAPRPAKKASKKK